MIHGCFSTEYCFRTYIINEESSNLRQRTRESCNTDQYSNVLVKPSYCYKTDIIYETCLFNERMESRREATVTVPRPGVLTSIGSESSSIQSSTILKEDQTKGRGIKRKLPPFLLRFTPAPKHSHSPRVCTVAWPHKPQLSPRPYPTTLSTHDTSTRRNYGTILPGLHIYPHKLHELFPRLAATKNQQPQLQDPTITWGGTFPILPLQAQSYVF